MVHKMFIRYLLTAVYFLILLSFLWSQSENEDEIRPGYIIESRVLQYLTWAGDELTLRYEVVIEKEENGRHSVYLREFTNETYIAVSLSPGKYRYRVVPYDFLNRPGRASAWMVLDVLSLLPAEIKKFSPLFFYSREEAIHTLYVYGQNISSQAEIFLRRLGGQTVIPVIAEISADGAEAKLIFENSQFEHGEYEIVIRNPGNRRSQRNAAHGNR